MRTGRIILYVLLIVSGLGGVARLNQHLTDQRRSLGITQADPLINAPPLVNLTTVALGGFRGMIADVMWIRLTALQQDGRYFEIIQLADWITKLEPRLSDVWAYHAWNLAYNISVMIPDLTERWRWVDQGIRLIRDEGLKYNPGDAQLLLELGWLFQNKIGAPYDEAHLLYKQQWASEMRTLLGGPRPDLEAIKSDIERSQRMHDEYRLDPELMQKIEDQYGPLNWLSPQTHAVYWAAQGLEHARGIEHLAAHRMIYQSMADAVWQGGFHLSPDTGVVFPRPCFELLPFALSAYRTAMTNDWGEQFVRTGYENFLRQSAVLFDMYERPETVQLIELIKEFDPDFTARGGIAHLLTETFVDASSITDPDAVHDALLFILDKAATAQEAGDWEQVRAFEKAASTLREYVITRQPETRLLTLEQLKASGK